MNEVVDLTIFASGVGIGGIASGIGVWFVMQKQSFQQSELIKAQTKTLIVEATNALKEENAKTGKTEREDFLNLAKREVGTVLDPMNVNLSRLESMVKEADNNRISSYASLVTSIGQIAAQHRDLSEATNRVSSQTSQLVGALKNSQVRGRWGEIQLRRVVELAGMVENCDFEEQVSTGVNEGRPDMNVHLPGSQLVCVDAKTPLTAYLEMDAETDERRKADFRREHAKAVRLHIDTLVKRNYHATSGSVGFTIMYVPGEAFLQAAMLETPNLIEFAAERNIYLCGPMTLLTLLRSYALGWREVRQEQRAKEIAKLGAEMYERYKIFTRLYSAIGVSINQTVTRWNEATGSYESRIMPQGKRMQETAALHGEDIVAPELIDKVPRKFNSTRLGIVEDLEKNEQISLLSESDNL